MIPTKAERREFLEERRRGIGGSDIAAICGVHPYKDAFDVYLEKTRPTRPEDLEIEGQNIHLWRGLIMEGPFRQLFEHLYDRPIQQFRDDNLKVHPDHEWVRVHLDGRQVSTGEHPFETTGAWEAKAPSKYGFQRVVESGLERYRIAQLQWELYASGYEWGSVAIGNLESDQGPLIKVDMRPHENMIRQMRDRAERFWFEHVKPREKPGEEWLESEDLDVPQVDGDRRQVEDPEMVRATVRLMKAYLIRNKARDLYKERKSHYQSLMEERGDVAIETPLGRVNFRWREGRTSFDREKLEKARPLDPDMVSKFLGDRIGDGDSAVCTLDTLIEATEMDLSAFESTGEPYRHFRPYPNADNPSELPEPDELKIEPHDEADE